MSFPWIKLFTLIVVALSLFQVNYVNCKPVDKKSSDSLVIKHEQLKPSGLNSVIQTEKDLEGKTMRPKIFLQCFH